MVEGISFTKFYNLRLKGSGSPVSRTFRALSQGRRERLPPQVASVFRYPPRVPRDVLRKKEEEPHELRDSGIGQRSLKKDEYEPKESSRIVKAKDQDKMVQGVVSR